MISVRQSWELTVDEDNTRISWTVCSQTADSYDRFIKIDGNRSPANSLQVDFYAEIHWVHGNFVYCNSEK